MEDLKLDACPFTPEVAQEIEENIQEVLNEDNIRISTNPEDTARRKASRKPKSSKKSSQFGRKSPTNAYASVININNSKNIQFGSTYQININKKLDKSEENKEEIIKTDEIIRLLGLKEKIERDHLIFISGHICEGWKRVGRYFNYSSGQINQFYTDYFKCGIKEVIYQLLLDWTQSQPDNAKLCNLASALWECEEKDAVRRLAKKVFS